jgi:hypothetical protein
MNFPAQSLLVLLKFAKGDIKFDQSVIDAGLEVLRYAWDMFSRSSVFGETGSSDDIVDCLVQALDEGQSTVKTFNPAIWVTIGLWVLEKVLAKLSK